MLPSVFDLGTPLYRVQTRFWNNRYFSACILVWKELLASKWRVCARGGHRRALWLPAPALSGSLLVCTTGAAQRRGPCGLSTGTDPQVWNSEWCWGVGWREGGATGPQRTPESALCGQHRALGAGLEELVAAGLRGPLAVQEGQAGHLGLSWGGGGGECWPLWGPGKKSRSGGGSWFAVRPRLRGWVLRAAWRVQPAEVGAGGTPRQSEDPTQSLGQRPSTSRGRPCLSATAGKHHKEMPGRGCVA